MDKNKKMYEMKKVPDEINLGKGNSYQSQWHLLPQKRMKVTKCKHHFILTSMKNTN
jgi:hypothetical protein